MRINNIPKRQIPHLLKRWNSYIYRIFGFTVMLLPLITIYSKCTGSWNNGVWDGYLASAFVTSVVLLNTAIIFEIIRGGYNTCFSRKHRNKALFIRHLLFLLFCIILLTAEILMFTLPAINL